MPIQASQASYMPNRAIDVPPACQPCIMHSGCEDDMGTALLFMCNTWAPSVRSRDVMMHLSE